MNDLDGFYARESAGHASTTAEGAALQLKVRFNNPPANAEAWLDHVGINTRARLRMEGSSLLFRDQEAGGSGHITRFVDRKSTRLNSSHVRISYAVFCLKKKKKHRPTDI